MGSRFILAFDRNRSFLEDRLDIDHGLLTKLSDYHVLTDRHTSDIKAKGERYAKVEKLLEILRLRDDGLFDDFIQALEETGQDDVVNTLRNTVSDADLPSPHQVQ